MIELFYVDKVYRRGTAEVHALWGINLTVPDGQFLSILGPSGSGKSTLLNVLGALDVPSTGMICIQGQAPRHLDDGREPSGPPPATCIGFGVELNPPPRTRRRAGER